MSFLWLSSSRSCSSSSSISIFLVTHIFASAALHCVSEWKIPLLYVSSLLFFLDCYYTYILLLVLVEKKAILSCVWNTRYDDSAKGKCFPQWPQRSTQMGYTSLFLSVQCLSKMPQSLCQINRVYYEYLSAIWKTHSVATNFLL